jgi:lambda family phage minor tail protein L
MADQTSLQDIKDIRASSTSKIVTEVQSLSPSAVIELFVLDLSHVGQGYEYFHAGTNKVDANIVWRGQTYIRLPIEAEGFEAGSAGVLPRPKFRLANKDGQFSGLVRAYADLIECKLIRKRTFAKFLDAVNFPGGVNPTADQSQHYPDDIWVVDQKVLENWTVIEWEIDSSFSLQNEFLPGRQITQNSCPWDYRGPECGYNGTNYSDINNNPVASEFDGNGRRIDVCGKRLSSCEYKFGPGAILPFGDFPGAMQYE